MPCKIPIFSAMRPGNTVTNEQEQEASILDQADRELEKVFTPTKENYDSMKNGEEAAKDFFKKLTSNNYGYSYLVVKITRQYPSGRISK